jgi:hypothetical protein
MRHRATASMMMMVVVLGAASGACKQRAEPAPDKDYESAPPGPHVKPGAVMSYGSGGGIAGNTIEVTAFADGRVERRTNRTKLTTLQMPVALVQKLASDLEATGVLAQKDGRWGPDGGVSDGVGSSIVLRDKTGAAHQYSSTSGGTAPDAVTRALALGHVFVAEVEMRHPIPRCACVAGDPLCSCL